MEMSLALWFGCLALVGGCRWALRVRQAHALRDLALASPGRAYSHRFRPERLRAGATRRL